MKVRFKKLRLWLVYPVFIVYPFLARITPASWAAGTALILLGLLVRFWASGYILKAHRLTTSGPYAHTRNPLYVGNFILGMGIVLIANHGLLLFYYMLSFLVIYWGTIREEEETLAGKYDDAYRDYCRAVPPFWPCLRPYVKAEVRRFSLERSFRNGEFIRVFGFLLLPSFFYVWMSVRARTCGLSTGCKVAVSLFVVFFGLLWFNIWIRRKREKEGL